jgi:hypothetical protein
MITKVTASLGAGSFDYDALKEKTDAALAGEHESPQAAKDAVQAAVAEADQASRREIDPRDTPGYKFEKRSRKIGEESVTEIIQVADPKPVAEDRPSRIVRRGEATVAEPKAAPAKVKE